MQSFSDIAIPASIKNALEKLKFVNPTEVQAATIPVALEGKDVIACAATGSGKTGAFAIPAITMLINNPEKNALILAPTRELAQQISEFIRQITDYCEGISMVSIVGGFDMQRQLNALRRKPRIIIATPGRLTDHLRRRSISLANTGILILDEGDRMLDMGFAPQLDAILQFLPQKRQTMLFTATLPPKVKQLASRYLHKPQELMVGRTSQPVETVMQYAINVGQEKKNDVLLDELNKRKGSVIVFARTQRRTDDLAYFLEDCGVDVTTIHGGLTQGKRNRAIQGFKRGEYRVLVATDIAARGIDVPAVEHVINFDLPLMDEDYVHRVGRTARNGAKGEAISFVSNHEYGLWLNIARKYKIQNDDVVDPRRNKGKKGKGSNKPARDFVPRNGKQADNSFFVTDVLPPIEVMPEAAFVGASDELAVVEETRAERPAKKSNKKDSQAFDPEDRVIEKALAEENLALDMVDGVKLPSTDDEGFIPAERYGKKKSNFEKRERFGKGSRFNDDEKPRGSKPFIDSFFQEDDNATEEQPERRERRFNNDGPRGGAPRFGGGNRFGNKSGGFGGARSFNRGGDRPEGGFKKRFDRDGGDRPEGGFKKRFDGGGFGRGGDRPEGGFKKRFDRDGGDRPEGGFKKRFDGGGFGRGGDRPEGGFKKRFDRDGGDRPEGGFKKRFDRDGGDRPDGGFKKRFDRDGGDRPEGGFKKRFDGGGFRRGGDRPEGGFKKRFDNDGGFAPKRRDNDGFSGGGDDSPKRKGNWFSKDKERRSFSRKSDARY
jgi:ATP-dependent RNA helicase DeaD